MSRLILLWQVINFEFMSMIQKVSACSDLKTIRSFWSPDSLNSPSVKLLVHNTNKPDLVSNRNAKCHLITQLYYFSVKIFFGFNTIINFLRIFVFLIYHKSLQKGLKNVFDEAILAALEPPEPARKKKCVVL